ncbi:hypothetical protein FQN50_000583 [Emmonsiellopsis sp. PD_5]|nr:hypothetical protein FQN50_000583 [Emmonsiellopsis sp. PD_5]
MASQFYFGDDSDASLSDHPGRPSHHPRAPSDSNSSDDDYTSTLPFPKPLSRAAFLSPTFTPTTFLSTLSNRHQTLSDLQSELRHLSQALNKELLDLVNENYTDFLSLGSALRGGEEKVEEVRVGLLGFKREVGGIVGMVEGRMEEVRALVGEKRAVGRAVVVGNELLDVSEGVEELEGWLMIGDVHGEGEEAGSDASDGDLFDSETDESDGDDDGDATSESDGGVPTVSMPRLDRHVRKYLYIMTVSERVGLGHPFIVSLQPRMAKIRTALVIDLKTALQQAKRSEKHREQRVQAVGRLYGMIGEQVDDEEVTAAMKKLEI